MTEGVWIHGVFSEILRARFRKVLHSAYVLPEQQSATKKTVEELDEA
jgi:hypothetical protein